jgi:dihydrodipicolinate synthase/N-acetylneuraminate lyase
LRDLIEHQINGGVRLLVPCGTTGESVTMTDEENASSSAPPLMLHAVARK